MIHLQVISEQSLCVEVTPSYSQIFDIWFAATFWLLSSIVVNLIVNGFFVQQCQFMHRIATFTRTVKGAGLYVGRCGQLIFL